MMISSLLLLLLCSPIGAAAIDDFILLPCSDDIVNHINELLSHPESLRIPLGRAWTADKFGVVLVLDTSDINYIKKHKDKVETDTYYVYANTTIELNVKMCKLPHSKSLRFYQQPGGTLDDICFISLGSRIVGKEIIHIESKVVGTGYHNTSTNLPCYWHLHFEHPILFHGDYALEVYTNWIHEFDEPTDLERGRSKEARLNDGVSKSLNGLGLHPYFFYNATSSWYDFRGYVFRGDNAKSLYFISSNNTRQEFYDGATFLALGFDFGIEKQVPAAFLNDFKPGPALKLSEIVNVTAYKMSMPKPIPYSVELFSLLISQVLANFGFSHNRAEAMVFNLPNKLSVLRSSSMEINYDNFTQYSAHYYNLPLCKSGDDLGRWVYNPECVNASADVNECAQGSPPYHKASGAYDFPMRSRHMVWRPYRYRLGSITRPVNVDSRLDDASNLKNILADYRYGNQPLQAGTRRSSTLRQCLKIAGVELISGFGDSLGDELRDNFNYLKGEDDNYTVPSIVCEHVQALNDVDRLIDCIKTRVYSTFSTNKTINSTGSGQKIKQVVLATNFRVQHSVGGLSMPTIEIFFKQQAIKHKELEEAFRRDLNISYRRIYYSAIAVNGFRLGGLTPLRQQRTNELAREYLVPSGWEVLDAYNMTVGRPDGTWDNTL